MPGEFELAFVRYGLQDTREGAGWESRRRLHRCVDLQVKQVFSARKPRDRSGRNRTARRAGPVAACLAPQVGCWSGEGIAMERAVAPRMSRRHRALAPFVKIEGQRIGAL